MSSDIDERTLREVHLAAFEAAVVEAGTWSVMSSYNRLNGTYASDHRWLLTELLREEWGFDGAVISDWGGTMSLGPAVSAGCDLEMPGPGRGAGASPTRCPQVRWPRPMSTSPRHGWPAWLAAPPTRPATWATVPTPTTSPTAFAVAGAVLLRNEGDVLPLTADATTVAVIGPCADPGQIMGGGSSQVNPAHRISPVDGLRARLGDGAVRHEPGCDITRFAPSIRARTLSWEGEQGVWFELFDTPDLTGEPVRAERTHKLHARFFGAVEGVADPSRLSARLRASLSPATSGPHRLGVVCAGQAKVTVDGAVVIEQDSATDPGDSFYSWGSGEATATLDLEVGVPVEIEVEYRRGDAGAMAGVELGLASPPDDASMNRAVDAAREADVAVVVVGLDGSWETEGYDRRSLSLPGRQDELVEAVAAANPRTVVVLNAGSPVAMPWLDRVPAVLQSWYPGQEFGRALAALLLGDENPSGKLPTTFPRRIEDAPAFGNYPGEDDHVAYAEGLHIGHRHYDRRGIEPLFCFGHGLSYTTFSYGEVRTSAEAMEGDGELTVEVDVTNTGDRAGAEVVQLYLAHPEAIVDRPVRTLRGFTKLALAPGETTTARFAVGFRDLARWYSVAHAWVADRRPGRDPRGRIEPGRPRDGKVQVTAPAERGP